MEKKKKEKANKKTSWSTRELVNVLLIGAMLSSALEWIIYHFAFDQERLPIVLIALFVLHIIWRVVDYARPYRTTSVFDSYESKLESKLQEQDIYAEPYRASVPSRFGPRPLMKQSGQAEPGPARAGAAAPKAASQIHGAASAPRPEKKKEESGEPLPAVTLEDLKALVADDISSKIIEENDGGAPRLRYIDRADAAFSKTYHPMLRRFSRDPANSAAQISAYLFLYRPYCYTVTQNRMKLEFDLGYIRAGYYENLDQIAFWRSCQESWHDGGGGDSQSFLLSSVPNAVRPKALLNGSEWNGLALPKHAGFWIGEEETLYIVDPFGLTGVFVLAYEKRYQPSAEDEETVQTLGNVNNLYSRIRQVEENRSLEEAIRKKLGDKVYTLEYIKRREWHSAEDLLKPQYAQHDQSLKKWRLIVRLDSERVWFLSVFVKDDGEFEKYSLDCELADDSHYIFTDEKGVRERLYQPGDEALPFAEILIRYVQRRGGDSLLREVYPYVTEEFHFD